MNENDPDRERWLGGDFVAGVIDSEAVVAWALVELAAAGFAKETIRVFTGERGSQDLRHIGGEGLGGILLRAAADYAGNAKELADRHKEEAARGHHVMIVPVAGAEPATQVREVIHAHSGHD